jgi:hypothetical protein
MNKEPEEEDDRAVVTLDMSQLADRQTWTKPCKQVDYAKTAPLCFYIKKRE